MHRQVLTLPHWYNKPPGAAIAAIDNAWSFESCGGDVHSHSTLGHCAAVHDVLLLPLTEALFVCTAFPNVTVTL